MGEAALGFQQIHDDFRPRIQRYLARLVGECDAEDLTQEVFVRISRALPSFRGECRLSTWVYRIAKNAAIDRLRTPSCKRIVRNSLLDVSDSSETEAEYRVGMTRDEAPSLEQEVLRKERYECYRSCVESLPENYRTVVVLSELEERAASEIADILGLSIETVKIRLHRGRARLLRELKARCRAEDWL